MDLWYQIRRVAHLTPVQIDGWVFRLHYWVTSTGILAASAVAFAKQYFGDPIECIFDAKNGAEIKAVDAYCWLHATVHLDSALLRKLSTLPRIRTPCRGFLPDLSYHDTNGELLGGGGSLTGGLRNSLMYEQPQHETLYYQWVPFFLLFQAMLFRLPWKLWRYMEGGKMEEFGLEAKRHIIGPEEEETLAHQYATAFHSVLHRNNLYFAQFVLCEALNLVTLAIVSASTDKFLDGQFWGYGTRVWNYHRMPPDQRATIANPMCSLFPTVTSCQFPSGALTGNLNVDHAMCVLSLNIINDKIFLLEWLWFALLSILTLISLFSTLIFVMFPSFRRYWIRRKARMWNDQDRDVIHTVLKRCHIGDTFLLHLISKNTNTYIYKRIIKSIAVVLREHKSTKNNTLHSRSSMGGDGSATGGPPGAPPGSLIGSHGGGSSIGGERVGTRYSIERLEFQTKNGV